MALFIAALLIISLIIRLWFIDWLSTRTIDDLYGALYWALLLVVIGVVIEEWKLIWAIWRFAKYTWNGKFLHAAQRSWAHRGEIVEGIGFIILVIGLAAELALDPSIEGAEKAELGKAQTEAANANERAAALENLAVEARKSVVQAENEAAQALQRAAKIEAASAWRVIPNSVSPVLEAGLKTEESASVEISWPANDPEALFLAVQFGNIFFDVNKKAGREVWKITEQARQFSSSIFWDIRITGKTDAVVQLVRSAFSAALIQYATDPIPNTLVDGPGMEASGITPSDVQVWVGPKRPPN